jgi:hypothetical protein
VTKQLWETEIITPAARRKKKAFVQVAARSFDMRRSRQGRLTMSGSLVAQGKSSDGPSGVALASLPCISHGRNTSRHQADTPYRDVVSAYDENNRRLLQHNNRRLLMLHARFPPVIDRHRHGESQERKAHYIVSYFAVRGRLPCSPRDKTENPGSGLRNDGGRTDDIHFHSARWR